MMKKLSDYNSEEIKDTFFEVVGQLFFEEFEDENDVIHAMSDIIYKKVVLADMIIDAMKWKDIEFDIIKDSLENECYESLTVYSDDTPKCNICIYPIEE